MDTESTNTPEKAVSPLETPSYYVTRHYRYTDFICPCCDMMKLVPGFYRHVELLERLADETGFAVTVTSGYRCAKHNAAVGGVPRSWHLLFATDVVPEDGDPDKLARMYEAAIDLGFGGIGRYERHIHLDLRPKPLRWRG